MKRFTYSTRLLRISPRKLNLVAKLIRKDKPKNAIKTLSFCNKQAALYVSKSINSAMSSAENNHNMNINNIFISEATVGKAKCLKRMRPRAKGKNSRINKYLSNLYITLEQIK